MKKKRERRRDGKRTRRKHSGKKTRYGLNDVAANLVATAALSVMASATGSLLAVVVGVGVVKEKVNNYQNTSHAQFKWSVWQ